ncbi:MAG TPA: hypothetical protein VN231_11250, partial [Allosphingosinicella sp.]|nr:hypothetical protein [Allosphingosinicella sp.]
MRLLRRARLALAAFALFAGLSAARAQLCPTLPAGASVDPVLVSIAATDERRPHRAMIRGALRMPAALADERLRGITRANLCLAAVGDMLIDDAALCPSFGDAYSSLDRIERAGDRVDFALFTDVPRRAGSGLLDIRVFESPDRCAPRATFVVAAARNQEITTVPLLVDRLSEGRIGWTERQWTPGFSRDLAIGLRERRPDLAGQGGSAAAEPNLNPPRSWTSYARGEMFERLQEFLWVPVWVAVILAGFMAFGGALLYAEAQPPLAALVRALTAAVALYAAARWSGVALDIAQLLYNARAADGGGWAARALNNVPAGVDYGSGRTIAAAALMIPLTLLLWLGSLFLGAPRSGAGLFRHTARLVLRSLAVGSLIGLAFLLVATLAGIALPPDTPFEPPALAVSLFLAIWAVIAFSPLTGFGWGRAALAAAVATLLLLYPHPVIHGAGEPPSAIANALIWFPYVGSYFVPNAMLLTVALVAALKIARSDDQGGQTLASDRTLLFLFGFSVTLSSIGSLTSAALLFGVLAAADRLLFPRDSTAAGGAAADAPSG